MPTWCVVCWLAWPIIFLSFMAHSFLIGGDAFRGKAENGTYYLYGYRKRTGNEPSYVAVSKYKYFAHRAHGIAIFLFAIPALIGTARVVLPLIRQGHAERKKLEGGQ